MTTYILGEDLVRVIQLAEYATDTLVSGLLGGSREPVHHTSSLDELALITSSTQGATTMALFRELGAQIMTTARKPVVLGEVAAFEELI